MPTMRAIFAPFVTDLGQPVILGLGISLTFSYGSLFYAYGVLAPAIIVDMNTSPDLFFMLFSIGLLTGGIFAPMIGKMLDRHGARVVMSIGSIIAAIALAACALAPNVWLFGAAVILMELAACLVLYEAGFAALTQIYGYQARRYITAVTLIAGFASTIFWPLTQFLLSQCGWRNTFAVFAIAHLALNLPLNFFLLKEARPVVKKPTQNGADTPEPPILQGKARQRAIILFALAICLSGFVYSAIPLHMLRIIGEQGFNAEKAAMIAMVMGPAQVIARIIEAMAGERIDALITGRIAHVALVLAMALMTLGGGSLATVLGFAALYGVSQGLISIARGAVPLQLFGIHGYATLAGRITGLRFFINSGAPFAFAALMQHLGMAYAMSACFVIAALALAFFLLLPRPQSG